MADPNAAVITQLNNIQAKTGKTIAELHAMVLASGAAKHGERRSWLMETLKLGHGDANTVVHFIDKPLPTLGAAPAAAVETGDALASIYAAKKAALLPLHEAVMAAIAKLGDFEIAPKKAYLSLRRSKQFAMVGPATASEIEIGLNCKTLEAHPRLKILPPGQMCQATTRISEAGQIDATLMAWIKAAYEAAA